MFKDFKMADMNQSALKVLVSVGGSVASTTLVAPLDRVKLLLQCQNEMIRTQRLDGPYKGIINCFKRTVSNEGFLSLWRSNAVHIILVLSSNALNFAVKDMLKDANLFKTKQNEGSMMKVTKNILAGGAAGTISFTLLYSLDYCRNRLACDTLVNEKGATRQFSGMMGVYRKTLALDGFRGLYRGFFLACGGIFVYRGMYFGLYDTLRPIFIGGDGGNVLQSFTLGAAVTLTAGMLSYPIDTVRRRMMMRSCEPVKYAGALDCASQIIKTEGFMSLMKGFSVNLLKGFSGVVMLITYDGWKFNRKS